MTKTILGTSLTMAPEVLEGKRYGLDADIYSLGVIFYQMVYGRFPYLAANDNELLKKIKNTAVNFTTSSNLSGNLIDLLKRMLTYNTTKRISWPDIYSHPLFNKEDGIGKVAEVADLYNLNRNQIDMKINQSFYEQKLNIKNNNVNQNQNQNQKPIQKDRVALFDPASESQDQVIF